MVTRELLEVDNLSVQFSTDAGLLTAVDGVSFTVREGEVLGLVGESGCGKSVTALSIMGLIMDPPGRISDGAIWFEGENLVSKSESDMRKIRGNRMSMVFQEPMTSLNPVLTIGDQVIEAITLHQQVGKQQATTKAINLLQSVEIPSAESRLSEYPHQLSGGMRQRVMIAMALASNPRLLIADEPTTALDVTIQAQILDLMRQLRTELGTAILLITHDLGVIAEMADRIAVMYAGQIVEIAGVDAVFEMPAHPYTSGLLASIPRIHDDKNRLDTIDGLVPSLANMPRGCRFSAR
jgi:ABC-type dipeptide/oligopeptide/nickel transport system ATPase component